MSQGLLRSKHKKNKLLRDYKAGRIQKEVYVRYNRIYRKLVFREQEKTFHKKIQECGANSKKKWRTLKEELKIASNKDDIETIRVNNEHIENKKDIAKAFKEHFETCASKLAENIPDTGECEVLIEQQPEWSFHKKLNEFHIIDDNQYGFRTEHSTEDAVVKFVDHIERLLPKDKFVVSVHIDVSKAFDSCNHEIMKKKLKKIGMSASALELMMSYLGNRTQEIWIESECGGRFVINIGVGQGTVLGPTLFKIYIMDMHLATKLFSLRFADDSNFVGSGNNKENTENEINEELNKLHAWFCKNKLTLHPDKSRYIVYTRDKLINIKLGGKSLMRCGYGLQEEGVKFLGVLIDENLDWKLQTKKVKKKIGKGNYLLWRYRNNLSTGMKKTIYESFVRTHLTYCLPVWGAKKTSELTELKKTIKRIWSKIGVRRQHTNNRLIEHKILKLEDELKLAELKIIWRWNKKRIPLGLANILTERDNRQLRNRQFIRDRIWRHDSLAFRLSTRAKNEITEIEIARSKKGLTKKYSQKCYLIDYAQPCRIRNCINCQPN